MRRKPFYGWYIVAVGFLSNTAGSFGLSSTLGIFLKPLTEELGVSRGVFSLLRAGENLITASAAPMVGTVVDRYGARWLMTFGALAAGVGYLLLSQIEAFSQFALIRLSFVTLGDLCMGMMVVNVTISRWFTVKRGRAIAFSSMGIGFGKIGMPLFVASLVAWIGWRLTWVAFGLVTLAMVVGPAAVYMRRRPEDMGLRPDGDAAPPEDRRGAGEHSRSSGRSSALDDVVWSRRAALRTRAFWLIVVTFGVSSVGVVGLNLHVFPYILDLGHSPLVAATAMSLIAFTQLASPMLWGLSAERADVRVATMLRFLVQAAGLVMVVASDQVWPLYLGFFLYGIGLGGNMVLPDLLWANYFGRLSLGTVRGLGLLIGNVFAAAGPPFFGFLFDTTGSYRVPVVLFILSLVASAILSLALPSLRK